MMKNPFIFVIFAFFLLITACQTKEQQSVKADAPVQDKVKKSTSEEQIRNLFLKKLQINMDENEVRDLFGASFSLVQNAMEGNESWRYDLGSQEGYTFDDQGIDQVDMEGLKKGRVQQQLFVDWSKDGKVNSAALYMRIQEKNGYFEYYLLPDNSREEKFTAF